LLAEISELRGALHAAENKLARLEDPERDEEAANEAAQIRWAGLVAVVGLVLVAMFMSCAG
jgi:hypothetical protein